LGIAAIPIGVLAVLFQLAFVDEAQRFVAALITGSSYEDVRSRVRGKRGALTTGSGSGRRSLVE
jgi:hypothetical protein